MHLFYACALLEHARRNQKSLHKKRVLVCSIQTEELLPKLKQKIDFGKIKISNQKNPKNHFLLRTKQKGNKKSCQD
jgi:uncharacterized membrane protein YobD (UPF0266 family)